MFSLSLLLLGFLSGISAYGAILKIAQLETVATSSVASQSQNIDRLNRESLENGKTISLLTIDNKNLADKIESQRTQLSTDTLAQLDGLWVNQDKNASGITRFRIQHRGADIFVHAWGSCHPQDCDWGEQRALVDEDSAVIFWDQGFVFRKMVIRLNKKTDLVADYVSVYTDDSGRKKSEKVEMFRYQQSFELKKVSNPPTLSPTSPAVDIPKSPQ